VFDRYWTFFAAAAMLLAGLTLAVLNEANYISQKQREMRVQTQILSASVAPALMFDAPSDAQDYLLALSANPDLRSAAVYDETGARVAAFNRADAEAPPDRAPEQRVRVQSPRAHAAAPVIRDGETLGSVYVEVRTVTFLQRLLRYAGVAVLVALATLVVIAVGLAHQALAKANQELEANAAALRGEIAERKKTEEALLQSRKMEAIGQLTGGIAHDFNNLLMVVISGLRMLDRHADPERRARTIEAMRQAAERGAVLMRQLLAFSRRQTLELETIDIGGQLKAMRPLLERSLRADILVEISVPHDLWPVKTDATQLEHAVL
jgi:signal transduction histidine kinase